MYEMLILEIFVLIAYNIGTRNIIVSSTLLNSESLPDKFWVKNKVLLRLYLISPDKISKGFLTVYIIQMLAFFTTLVLYLLNCFNVVGDVLFESKILQTCIYGIPLMFYIVNLLVENICNSYFKNKNKS